MLRSLRLFFQFGEAFRRPELAIREHLDLCEYTAVKIGDCLSTRTVKLDVVDCCSTSLHIENSPAQ